MSNQLITRQQLNVFKHVDMYLNWGRMFCLKYTKKIETEKKGFETEKYF